MFGNKIQCETKPNKTRNRQKACSFEDGIFLPEDFIVGIFYYVKDMTTSVSNSFSFVKKVV